MRRLVAREVEHLFVDKTPAPRIGGKVRLHDRMTGRMEVFGRVPVFRTIAAADVAARAAYAQVHPRIAHFQTLFTTVGGRRHFANGGNMRAGHKAPGIDTVRTRSNILHKNRGSREIFAQRVCGLNFTCKLFDYDRS
jgi:hypothetical protein